MEIVAVKSLCVAAGLLLLQCGLARADDQTCIRGYYRTRLPACVDDLLSQFRGRNFAPDSEPASVIGFLAQIFIASPEEKRRLLANESSDYVKSMDIMALYRANLIDDARRFADENRLSDKLQKMETSRLASLAAVRPSIDSADNNLLIGAYMASGDTTLIQRILENFSSADDGTVSDALRIGFMQSKFGLNFPPNGRKNVTGPTMGTKYQYKTDPTRLLRVVTLSDAFWALQSLSRDDEGIKRTLADVFEHDARLNKLLAAEQAAFENYLTALAVISANKPDQVSADGNQTYEAMSKAALAYEKLEPARDVSRSIEDLARSGKPPN